MRPEGIESPGLVAERLGCGCGRDLGYVEQSEQIRNLQRHGTVRAPYHAEYRSGARRLLDPWRRSVRALEHAHVQVRQRRPHEVQALVKGVRVPSARVQNVHPYSDPG